MGTAKHFVRLATSNLGGTPTNKRLQSFEALNQRAVAVVVDPVQSVKGKVGGLPWVGESNLWPMPTAHALGPVGGNK